jgi:hypothetical protein
MKTETMTAGPEQTQLQCGVYVLTRDVKNPAPDRRKSRDWRKSPVILRGTKVVVAPHPYNDSKLILQGRSRWPQEFVLSSEPLFALLAEALEPAPVTVCNMLLAADRLDNESASASSVLQHLVNKGTVSYTQVREAISEVQALSEQDAP